MTTIFLMRHGQTTWNLAARMQGRLDSPLTALGQVQAARQGALLRAHGVTAPALCSPRGRARATAALAGLLPRVDDDLAEISMGQWEGQDGSVVPVAPGVTWKFSAPGGETQADLIARLTGVLARLSGPTIIVTHGVVCIGLRALLRGLDPLDWDRLDDPQGVIHLLEGGEERIFR